MKTIVTLEPQKALLALGSTATVLVLANLAGVISTYVFNHNYIHGLVPLFDVDREANLPTLFSTFLLLFSTLLLFAIAAVWKKQAPSSHQYWSGLGWVFLFLTVDEAIQIHEPLIDPLRSVLQATGVWFYTWVLPYGIALVLLTLFYFRFFLQLPPRTRGLMALAAGMYIGGALGLEMIGGWYLDLNQGKNLLYGLLTTLEESLEMFGSIMLIYALMDYLGTTLRHTAFNFGPVSPISSADSTDPYENNR